MIELFTLEGIQKKAAVFDTTKLEWMNGQYLSALPARELVACRSTRARPNGSRLEGRDLAPLIDAVKARSRTILHVAQQVAVRLDPARAELDPKGEALIRKLGPAFGANLLLATEALGGLGAAELGAGRDPGATQGDGGHPRTQARRCAAADPCRPHGVDGLRAGERAARRGRARPEHRTDA